MPGLLKLMRPTQWVKNGFVLAPLIFTGQFTDEQSLIRAFLATALFCLASSAVYIINDYRDIESDRQHPVKSKKRPLASGEVSPGQALYLLGAIVLVLLAGAFFQPAVMVAIAVYIVMNIAYTFYLKDQPVVDLFVIAIGFVLRVWAGALALSVAVSGWMFITTFCLALYLAAIKRRQELALGGTEGRKVLEHYSVTLIDRYAEMSATSALLFYALFVMTTRPELTITIPVVMFGFFRYWYLVEIQDGGESPTDALLTDIPIMSTVLVWVVLSALVLWPTAG